MAEINHSGPNQPSIRDIPELTGSEFPLGELRQIKSKERISAALATIIENAKLSYSDVSQKPVAELNLTFSPTVKNKILEHTTGALIRPEGIACFPTRGALIPQQLEELQNYIEADFQHQQLLTLMQALERVRGIRGDTKVYHATNALSYTFAREIGWINPADLGWFVQDYLKLQDWRTGDMGCFCALDPMSLSGYGTSAFEGSLYGRGGEIFEALGIPTSALQIRSLFNTILVLEIDLRAFASQLPDASAPLFLIRQHDISRGNALPLEIATPLLANDQDPDKFSIISAIECSGRIE